MMARFLALLGRTGMRLLKFTAFCCLIVDLINFLNLASDLCSGTTSNPAGFCTNGTYYMQCLPVPDNCKGWLEEIPPLQFNFAQIVRPDFGSVSVWGFSWWLLEYGLGFGWNCLLFAWFVLGQPFLKNPPLWLVIINIIGSWGGGGAAVNSMLSTVQNQKALGDASTASASAVHLALVGKGNTPTLEFED